MEVLKKQDAIIESFRKNFEELYDSVEDLNNKKMTKINYE